MEEKIIKILKDLVSIDSFSATENEHKVVEYLYDYMKGMDYFIENPELFGKFDIEDDYLNRQISYGLVRGKSNKTVVLMNHYDVVGIDDYGSIKEYAFDIDKLPEKLKTINIHPEAKEDLESNEWIFGRGACDMKGGLAIHLACLEEYSKNPDREGNILFISVPDEESYSAGMRGAAKLLNQLKDRYNLDYVLLLDSEPNYRKDGEQIISIGTAGKCMPVVLVQGEKAHISRCFDGLNPIGILSKIFLNTELSLEFSDEFEGEVTVPPTWNYFKDMKVEYDVSIPIRASGYFSVISFSTTPDEILEKLKKISEKAFKEYVEKMKSIYAEYRKLYKYSSEREINYQPVVMTFEELCKYIEEKDRVGFKDYYETLYGEIAEKVKNNEINYPQATIYMMDKVLDYSGINYPVVLLGFAPPYYPAVASNNIKGWENVTTQYFNFLKEYAFNEFEYKLTYENYTVGLSDCSYCAIDKPFDFEKFSLNTPMWGKLYSIDFEAIEKLNIPFLILGPWGKDLHQPTERVHRKSLTRITPALTKAIINHVFNN